MNVRYYIDPETDAPHIYNHQVSETEVEDVLRRPGEDRPAQDGARMVVGQASSGRILGAIYGPDPKPDSVFVIAAYEFTGKALLTCRRRRPRKR